ncbi:MAG TPA: hypothetical protein VF575_01705 [Candidatus Saccharimonadales bacterium]|jgi:type II secretory pathway pseudopilin PulG
MKIWSKKFNQSGDTIVEVLIALAVISSVLAGAFLVSQKSAQAVRNGQEQAEMLQILQGQVEQTRSMALAETNPVAGIFATSPRYFCVNDSDANNLQRANYPASFDIGNRNFDDYEADCKKGRYNVIGTYDSGAKTFTFYGRWDGISGGKNEVKLSYRVYPATAAAASIATLSSATSTPSASSGPSPSPSPAPRGQAEFTNNSNCGGAFYPPCPPPPANGRYIYYAQYTNISLNDPSIVIGCTWNWGDGTVERLPANDTRCQYGQRSSRHLYAVPAGELPYPQQCSARTVYRVTLVMHLINGVNTPPYSSSAVMPVCA